MEAIELDEAASFTFLMETMWKECKFDTGSLINNINSLKCVQILIQTKQ